MALAAADIKGWGRRLRGPDRGARCAGRRVGGRAGEGRGLSTRNRTGRAEGQRRKAERRDLRWEAQTPRALRGRAGGVLSPAPAPFHLLPPADYPGLGYPRARAPPGSGPSPALEGAAAFTDTFAAVAPEAARVGPGREHRVPPKEYTTLRAALNADRARRAHKNGHCRYFPVSKRESGRVVGKGLGTGSVEMEGGGVGPGLARPRLGGG